MPIRMEKDDHHPKRNRPSEPNPPRPRKPGGNIPIIGLLLGLIAVIIKPRYLVPVLLIIALYYFFSMSENSDGDLSNQYQYEVSNDAFSFGAELDEKEYDKTYMYEPLAAGSTALPRSVLLEDYAPTPLHQGSQGSCSGWACAYGARTISYARANGKNPDQVAFSPSFLYNQIALPRCQGAYLHEAMKAMQSIGSLPFKQFGYTDQTCQLVPDYGDRGSAAQYKIKGYTRLTQSVNNYTPDIPAIKQHLAQGAPVVIGMMVGQSFQHSMMGKKLWNPSRAEYAGSGLGGHAMCVVGYDDDVAGGGAFRIMNSWGRRWGDNGFAWVKYRDFQHFTKEAYGIFPEGKSRTYDRNRLEAKFALVASETNEIIPLTQADEIVFRTTRPIKKDSKFKVAITNSVECYTYVFGMESDGSSYVLFPYTNRHSSYCGITGTRLFPRDYSMVPDRIGNKDYIAIVVSKKSLDYERINRMMNASRGRNYMMRMVESLIDDFVLECDFNANGAVSFDCQTGDRSTLGMIIEIDKI